MTDSNDDLDNPSEDFEEAFEVQDGGSAGDFEPAEAPSAPESFGEDEPIDGGPADEDPLDDLELELGAELDQIVKPKQEFTIGGDDEYDSIESESVASAPKRSAEEEEARQRARARAERNRLRRWPSARRPPRKGGGAPTTAQRRVLHQGRRSTNKDGARKFNASPTKIHEQ